ncbi:MAG TPA: hypothetical protein VIV11_39690 [Kofleriaceae bacterium]
MAKTKGKSQKGKASGKSPVKAGQPAKAAKAAPPKTAAAKVPAPKTARAKPSLQPSLPLPPPPPPKPEPRDELPAPRDIARLTRYGERFGPHKIDVRWLPLQLPVTGNALAVFDPAVPKSWRVFDRPVGIGQFRAMLSIARSDDGKERLAAIVIHVGRPPIARWTVAHYAGQKKPKSAEQLPRVAITSGWLALIDARGDAPGVVAVPPASLTGIQPIEVPLVDGRRALALPCGNGEYAAYWAVDEADKPIALVVDFDVFTQKEWKARPPTT